MNKIIIRYILSGGDIIEKYISDNHKIHCIDLNLLVLLNAPIDTDYIKSISIKIFKDVK